MKTPTVSSLILNSLVAGATVVIAIMCIILASVVDSWGWGIVAAVLFGISLYNAHQCDKVLAKDKKGKVTLIIED